MTDSTTSRDPERRRAARVSGGVDDRAIAIEAVFVEEVTDLFLNELDELFVVDHIALVQSDEDTRHAHLTSEQHVLAGLSHRAVGGGHNEDSAIHLAAPVIMFFTKSAWPGQST